MRTKKRKIKETNMHKKLLELKNAGINVDPLLKNPELFMSVARIGPVTAHEIYKELSIKKTLKDLERVYNKIDNKTKLKGKKLKETIKQAKIEAPDKVKHPLHILKNHEIPIEDILGQFKVILGTTGQGKSNTVAVLIEEYLKYGVPIHIIDVEGEHLSFVDELDFEVINKKNYYEDELKNDIKHILRNQKNVVIDFSSFNQEKNMNFLKHYLETLWTLQNTYKTPMSLIIEEVHTLVPQNTNTPVKKILQDFAKRGRKRKIEAIFVTQRTQEADKSIITQAEVGFLHKVSHPTNLSIYKTLIPSKELFNKIPQLGIGEVIYVNKGTGIKDKVRLRKTKHGSHTLRLEDLKKKKEHKNLLQKLLHL